MKAEQLYKRYKDYPLITTDSRKVVSDSIFFALSGPRFNGNTFAEDALKKGARYVVIDDESFRKEDGRYILVEDTLKSLQQLALYHRRKLKIPVIAITGSNGKTTTKELTTVALQERYKVHATPGNYNNHIGVPLTLLSAPFDTDVMIVEMGASGIGEIEDLCRLAEPDFGLITNIGKAHIEGFGSYEGVIKAKSELYRYLQNHDGYIFYNGDDELLCKLSEGTNKRIKFTPDTSIEVLNEFPYLTLKYKEHVIHSNLVGKYNVSNIAAAMRIGSYFEVADDKLCAAISSYKPVNNRSQILKKESNHFILDAYNANPSSMLASIDSFEKVKSEKKILILGDMLELGNTSEREHMELLLHILEKEWKSIILVGNCWPKMNDQRLFYFNNTSLLKTWFLEQSFTDHYFLLKGSRGIALEEML